MKGCLRKRGLYVREARIMVQDRREGLGFVRRNAWGVAREIKSDLKEMPKL